MKKLLTVLCAMLLVVALGVSASAAEGEVGPKSLDYNDVLDYVFHALPKDATVDEQVELIRQTYLNAGFEETAYDGLSAQSEEIPEEVTRLAYMDLDNADEATKEEILKARNVIIYSHSWRADDVIMGDANPETGEFTLLPKFSELFPGWDIPKYPVEELGDDVIDVADDSVGIDVSDWTDEEIVQYSTNSYKKLYESIGFPKNNPNTQAPIRITIRALANAITTVQPWVPTLPSTMKTYNVGYRNTTTGEDLGYTLNCNAIKRPSPAVVPARKYSSNVGIRFSTDSTPSTADVVVEYTYTTT